MKKLKYLLALGLIFCSFARLTAQDEASVILRSVYDKMQKARDYSVQANIKVDMPFIRMLPIDVKLYYKQKNKFKVVSKGIAMVPRQGFNQLSGIMGSSEAYTSIVQGNEKIGDISTVIVNIIPLTDTTDLIFGKFWIDPLQHVIIKSQLTTRSSGTILTDFTYGSQVSFGLPDKMIFTVDVKKFKMPKGMSGTLEKKEEPKTGDKNKEGKKGKILIVLSGYNVNKGIEDSFFIKQ